MSKQPNHLSRRQFVSGTIGLAGLVRTGAGLGAPSRAGRGRIREICIFSKHLQWLDFDAMAETAAELGFDGIDLTVRPGGHVAPERVATDLPKAVRAVRAAGLQVPMMATAITDSSDPLTEPLLATASDLGIRHYRLGYYRYSDEEEVSAALARIQTSLAGLQKLNEKHGICGNYQNHAGKGYFGASVWDLWATMKDLDSRWIGSQFDLRHAIVEGTMNWSVDFRLISSLVKSLAIKDFRWDTGTGEVVENCPLGEGIADYVAFWPLLADSAFEGPLSVHCEYELGGAEHGRRELTLPRKTVLDAIRKDLTVLHSWLDQANLS